MWRISLQSENLSQASKSSAPQTSDEFHSSVVDVSWPAYKEILHIKVMLIISSTDWLEILNTNIRNY